MSVLAHRDAERVLRFLGDAEELAGDHAFTPEVLERLGELVPADEVCYCELDRVRKHNRFMALRPGDDGDEPEATYWEIARDYPTCRKHDSGDFRAFKLSDFLSLRKLRRSRIYALWFRPAGVEREISIPIPSPPWHTKTFIFDRRIGARDFTERDRLVLDLLQPHFARLWRAAETRRLLRAAFDCLDSGSEEDVRGVVVLAPQGQIAFASPAARRLLRDYLGESRGADLPPALAEWLQSGAPVFMHLAGDRRLTVRRSGDSLLLEEKRGLLDLTPREHQILAWVARGKTNREVAELLWIAPTTVRKHLENVYAKLGVTTRTAAVARFLGHLDA
ncbi:MAG TPA: LuxR C-terminal-related transcriptional regulator [Gaiellaceae bacterium]|nr:LuxR C-terminal-related transcriptional regulator [Gaiellaceae bacterium]